MKLNLYDRIINQRQKMKIKKGKSSSNSKIKKSLLTISTTAILISTLTGCSVSNNARSIQEMQNEKVYTEGMVESQNYNSEIESITQTTEADYSLSYNRFLYERNDDINSTITLNNYNETDGISKSGNNADRRLATGTYQGTEISLSEEDLSTFVEYISSKDVIYIYEDYYNIEEALAKTAVTVVPSEHTHTLITRNTEINLDLLVNIIINNNEEYLKKYPDFYSLTTEDIKEIASYIIESLEMNKENLTEQTLDRVYCQISNLKIVGFDSANPEINPGGNIINAQYCTDNTIVIDKKQIALLPDEEAKAKTYKHEINHIYHRVCEDELDNNYQIVGISQFWNDLNVNPLFWRWHYEAASESMVMSEYNTQEAVVYKNFVSYLRSLDLIALLNPNYKENAIELSTLNNNPKELFDIFGAQTIEEQKEIIKLMYSIDYIQIKREDFEKEYERETGSELNSSLQVKYEMKKSVCTTLAKYFYRNLAERINSDNISLEDVFYLINVFEADLNTHILYDESYDESIKKENEYFLNEYIEIQNNFFKTIALNNGMDENKVIELFNEYAMVIKSEDGIYSRNSSLEWLEESEREFIYNILTHNITSFTNNIRNVYDISNHEYIRK